MQPYDNYEIHPVIALDEFNQPTKDESLIINYEHCEESDPDLYAWAVFGHVTGMGIQCIADCADKSAAELIYAGLMERLRNPSLPALLDAALMAKSSLCAYKPALNINQAVDKALGVERAIRALDRAISGAKDSDTHILLSIEKSTIRQLLPDIDNEKIGEVMEAFSGRLKDGILQEHIQEIANETLGMRI